MVDYTTVGEESKQPAVLPAMCAPMETKTVQSWHEMKQTEDLLSAELNKLTVEEREKAMDDLHCMSKELSVETLEEVQKVLKEFHEIVDQMQNPIYTMALNQNRAYVEDPSFRLRFLRCNLYDVRRSVSQMMDFLKYKAAYFGEDKLSREITLEDLNEEDLKLLQLGLYHIQEERDRSGRVILHAMGGRWDRCKVENLIHVAFYVWNNVLIPELDVQMRGICCVAYDVTIPGEKYVAPELNFMITASNVIATFPLRYSAVHVCLKPASGDLPLKNSILSHTLKLLSKNSRVRTRLHYGSHLEVQYYLRSHGIPTESFPVDLDGNIRKGILNSWFYQHKKEVEAQKLRGYNIVSERFVLGQSTEERELGNSASFAVGDTASNLPEQQHYRLKPSARDVLLGRGWKIQNHEGNVRFREFLVSHGDEYDTAPRLRKRSIARGYVDTLRRQGVRFWKQAPNEAEWVAATSEEAENKVAQMFRTLRKNAK